MTWLLGNMADSISEDARAALDARDAIKRTTNATAKRPQK
jgi:hypothetical protein